MIQASVGWQCPDCVRQGAKNAPVQRVRFSNARTGIVGSTNPTPAVIAIVVVNVICFVASGGGKQSVLDRLGGLSHQVQQSNEYYRLFTSMFLHVSIFHIASNMFTLIIVGPAVEVMLGRVRFVALYLLAGLGGSVASYLFAPGNSVSAGASGAIFGVMGAYVVLAHNRRQPLANVMVLIVINLVIGFAVPGIDWRDHFGGLVVGFVLAAAYDWAAKQRPTARQVALTVGASVATLIVLALIVKVVPPGHILLIFG
jgi:membrane associated rhomboid family serine protease